MHEVWDRRLSKNDQGLTPLHLAAERGHVEVCQQLVDVSPDEAVVLTPELRTPLHLAAMRGHTGVAEVLLATNPKVLLLRDFSGARALDYAQEHGWHDLAIVLGAASHRANGLRTHWRARFDPPLRARLNVKECDAYLEMGQVRILRAEYWAVNIAVRVIDALGLIESYVVEASTADHILPSAVLVDKRREDQAPIDDINFRIPRRRGRHGTGLLAPGSVCFFRILGLVSPGLAAKAEVLCHSIASEWSAAVRLPGCAA